MAGFLPTAGIPRLGPQGLRRLQQAQTVLPPAAATAQGEQRSQTALQTPRQQGMQRLLAVAQEARPASQPHRRRVVRRQGPEMQTALGRPATQAHQGRARGRDAAQAGTSWARVAS